MARRTLTLFYGWPFGRAYGVCLAALIGLSAPAAWGARTNLSTDTTLAATNQGVNFQSDVTLTVGNGRTIGATSDVSVSTGGGAPRGTLLFQGGER